MQLSEISDRPATLDALMKPRSIAVIGASQRRSRGTNVLINLKKTGYSGAVYAINPRYDQVEGFACYPTVADVPEVVDCVVAAIPADAVTPALEGAFEAGARGGVVLSSGFGEGGHANAERVAALRGLAARGMSICGPNCYGIFNIYSKAAPFSGGIPDPLIEGSVGVISQSGGFSNGIADPLIEDRGIGCSYLISCGNQLGVAVEDYMEYLLEDENTRLIAAFVEGFRKPEKLATVGARARELGKPIVVLKSGRSEAGKAAARSHTGSLAGSTEVLASLLRRHGFIQVGGLDQMIETVALFSVLKNDRPFRREIVVVTGSGGEGSHVADAAEVAGIGMAELAATTKERIEAALPEFGAAVNPVDGTGAMFEGPELFPTLMDLVLADPHEGVVAVNLGARDRGNVAWAPMRDFAKTVAAKAPASGKVVIAYGTSALGAPDHIVIDTLREAGVPYLAGTQYAMQAIAALYEYRQQRSKPAPPPPDGRDRTLRADLPAGVLPFLQARDALADFGIPIVRTELARSAEEAVAAAERVGYPVALKIEAANLTHKTEAGGVVLGSASPDEVRAAFERIVASAKAAGHSAIEGVLVQPMERRPLEAFAGITVDPILGPALVFGLGGIFVEVLRDTVTEVPPLDIETARAMVLGIRGRAILEGARGRQAADVDSLAALLVGLGNFAIGYRDRLVSVDLNPILVGAAGEGATAVDVLVELKEA